jgi:C4-dicarboxylate-specific signal transduction histidine kinase
MVTARKPPDAVERIGAVDPMPPAVEAGKGRYSEQFLAAIDWALRPDAKNRPRDIAEWRRALFAAHAGSLNLQDALMAGEANASAPRRLGARALQMLRTLVSPGAWPLALKMTLAMVLTALMPMVITAYYNLQGSVHAMTASELSNLEQLAHSTAGRVSQLVADSQHLARTLGTDAAFVDFLSHPDAAGTQAMRAKLVAVAESNPDIHLLMLMDTQGTAVVSSDPEVMGKNFRFRDYFKTAMQGRANMTGIVVGSVAGAAGMFYSNPVFDGAGQVIGAVVLRIRASSFTRILDEVRVDPTLTPFLVDSDGVVVYHPDPQRVYKSLMPLPESTRAAIRADQRFRRNVIDSLDMPVLAGAMVGARTQGHVDYRSSRTQRSEITGFAPVAGPRWVVGVTESKDDFEQPLNDLFRQVLVSVALVGLLFLGLALRFARSIVAPIRALTRAADALKSGDYDSASVKVRNRDEIGQLARTFNVLIDVLRQREREQSSARGMKARGSASE